MGDLPLAGEASLRESILAPVQLRRERCLVYFLAVLFAVLLAITIATALVFGWLAPGFPQKEPKAVALVTTPTPFQPWMSTRPPFLPVGATPTPSPTPPPSPTAFPFSYQRFGIDFNNTRQTIKIDLSPPDATVNNGRVIKIAYRPGWPCEWTNHRGCTSLIYRGQVVLVTLHSGVGGEGQPLRGALEGTWLDSAAFKLARVRANLTALRNADVKISQENATAQGIRVLAAARIPAGQVAEYFNLPVDEAINLAAQSSGEMTDALASQKPLLVIETCGWRQPEEPYAPGISSTSASVYLVVIGE
jgi:hypothetical protein